MEGYMNGGIKTFVLVGTSIYEKNEVAWLIALLFTYVCWRYVDGWMDEWMNGWMDEWVVG